MVTPQQSTPSSPRVLLVSPRQIETAVWRCGQVECEDVICASDDVHLLTPQRIAPKSSWLLHKAQRASAKLLHLEFGFTPRVPQVKLERDYEALFFYAQSVEDLAALRAVADWKTRCAKKICFLEELWVERLRRYGDYGLEGLRDFDVIGVCFRESATALRQLTGLPVEWVPGAVDALRFYPGATPPRRTIDIYSMGRRSETSHEALLEYSERRGWTYLFDTLKPEGVLDGKHQQHRTQLAAMIKRSRYFIANKSRVGADDTGGQEDLGYRSYEGAAGGAILIGDAPKSRSAELLFDWPDAHLDVPFGSLAIIDTIEQLERDPERCENIRRTNVAQCLRRHDWSYRWQQLLAALELAPHDKLTQRLQQLQTLADAHAPTPVVQLHTSAARA
jgi:hypothetical protein